MKLKMIEVLGMPPSHMIEAGTKLKKLFIAEEDHFLLHPALASHIIKRNFVDILGVEMEARMQSIKVNQVIQ